MTHPLPLDLTVFNGTFSFNDSQSFLTQGVASALLLLDNAPSGVPAANAAAAARSFFLGKGLGEGSPITVVGFKGFINEIPVIHVVRG
jgi:hypothetical protein